MTYVRVSIYGTIFRKPMKLSLQYGLTLGNWNFGGQILGRPIRIHKWSCHAPPRSAILFWRRMSSCKPFEGIKHWKSLQTRDLRNSTWAISESQILKIGERLTRVNNGCSCEWGIINNNQQHIGRIGLYFLVCKRSLPLGFSKLQIGQASLATFPKLVD